MTPFGFVCRYDAQRVIPANPLHDGFARFDVHRIRAFTPKFWIAHTRTCVPTGNLAPIMGVCPRDLPFNVTIARASCLSVKNHTRMSAAGDSPDPRHWSARDSPRARPPDAGRGTRAQANSRSVRLPEGGPAAIAPRCSKSCRFLHRCVITGAGDLAGPRRGTVGAAAVDFCGADTVDRRTSSRHEETHENEAINHKGKQCN